MYQCKHSNHVVLTSSEFPFGAVGENSILLIDGETVAGYYIVAKARIGLTLISGGYLKDELEESVNRVLCMVEPYRERIDNFSDTVREVAMNTARVFRSPLPTNELPF